jgi:hypothetical protein
MSIHTSVKKPLPSARLTNSTKDIAVTNVTKVGHVISSKTVEGNAAAVNRLQEARKVLRASHKVPTPKYDSTNISD